MASGIQANPRTATEKRSSSHIGSGGGLPPPLSISGANINGLTIAMGYIRPANEAANAIHLICSRTSLTERRKRSTRLTAEARIHRGSSGRTTYLATANQESASTPKGLFTPA